MSTTPEQQRVYRPAHPAVPSAAPRATRARAVRRFHWDRLPLVSLGMLLLGVWWAAGGKWTIDGLPLLINVFFAFFHISIRLAPLTNPVWYALLCWLPFGISIAEHKYAPWRSLRWSLIMIYVIGVWLIVCGMDFGSTFLAVTHPTPDAWLLSRQVAALMPLAALWSLLTTFAPEIGMSVLWWWVWEPDHGKPEPQ